MHKIQKKYQKELVDIPWEPPCHSVPSVYVDPDNLAEIYALSTAPKSSNFFLISTLEKHMNMRKGN